MLYSSIFVNGRRELVFRSLSIANRSEIPLSFQTLKDGLLVAEASKKAFQNATHLFMATRPTRKWLLSENPNQQPHTTARARHHNH